MAHRSRNVFTTCRCSASCAHALPPLGRGPRRAWSLPRRVGGAFARAAGLRADARLGGGLERAAASESERRRRRIARVRVGRPSAPPAVERSKPPTVAEWKDAKKLPLAGGDWVGCDAEQVREWVRVSCRASKIAAKPAGVRVTKGKGPDVLPYAKNGVASVLFRFVPGVELAVLFGWEDDLVLPYAVSWPAGAARPATAGGFTGLPTKKAAADAQKEACACFWEKAEANKAMDRWQGATTQPDKADACVGVPSAFFDFHCVLDKSGDCDRLQECDVRGGPSVYVECLPGEEHRGVYPSAECGRVCTSDDECPEGFGCGDDGRVKTCAHGTP